MNTAALRRTARHFAWIERRLFEVLGGWVASVPEPEAKLVLRTESFRHAWHAELWEGIAPEGGPAFDMDEEVAAVLDALARAAGSAARLAGTYRVVLPALVDAYRAVAAHAQAWPASGGPLGRALSLMLADDEAALRDGGRLLERVADAGEPERELAARVAKIGGVGPRGVVELLERL